MTSKIYEPLEPPLHPLVPISPVSLTEDQISMYTKVEKRFQDSSYGLPNVPESEQNLTAHENFWLSYECIHRYLRATGWNLERTIERLEDTLKWRRDFGFETVVTASHVEPEAVTGKEIIFGFDYWGRPAFYMIPSRQNTTDPIKQNQYAVWMLERCIDFMPPGVETIDLLIDYADKAKNPSLQQSRQMLHILQTHYPERLGLAIVMNTPWLLQVFFKMITPFIDPHTITKLKFNPTVVGDGPKEGIESFFKADQVMSESTWGGSMDFEYVHEKYWPRLLMLSVERRSAWMARWEELGGTVGIKEVDYKAPKESQPLETKS